MKCQEAKLALTAHDWHTDGLDLGAAAPGTAGAALHGLMWGATGTDCSLSL